MKGVAASADGTPICYEVQGAGRPAVVFVHGWSCDRTYWRHQLRYFAEGHQVLAIDLAGHGESGVARKAMTMPAFGDDIVAVVEQEGLNDMVMIGHSMGGDAIVEAALKLRGRVAGLVWVDVYNTLGETSTPDEIESFVAPFREDFASKTRQLVRRMFVPSSDTDLVEWVVADMSAAPPQIAVDAMEHAIGNDGPILARLRELTVPVLAINPDYRSTDVESLVRYGVHAALAPGVGHFLMLEEPDTFNRWLEVAIEGIVRGRGTT
jgi:pimeloyl-ACP methyl ester carboxylesterase